MICLAFALAALLWERLENIPFSLRAIPVAVLAVSIWFAPSEEQLDQLSQVFMRSQRNFKELIPSIDDPACAVSLGERDFSGVSR
jgi:hypothetical protein